MKYCRVGRYLDIPVFHYFVIAEYRVKLVKIAHLRCPEQESLGFNNLLRSNGGDLLFRVLLHSDGLGVFRPDCSGEVA